MCIMPICNRKNLINPRPKKKILFIEKKPHDQMHKDNLDVNSVIFYGII